MAMSKIKTKGIPGIAKTNIAYGFGTTIPKEIRKTYGVEKGMQVVWCDKNGEIRVYFRKPIKSMRELEGSIRGGWNLSKTGAEEFVDKENSL